MKTLLFLFLMFNIGSSSAAEFPLIESPWLRAAPPGANMMAAYLQIENQTGADKILVDAYSPAFAVAEIHKTQIIDGVARMRHQERLNLLQGQRISFSPGGLHVMLMMPKQEIRLGDEILICLIYEGKSGEREVQHINFPVKKSE